MVKLFLGGLMVAVLTGCSASVDRFSRGKVLPAALALPDLGKACALGEAAEVAMRSMTPRRRPPRSGVLVAEVNAGLCDQMRAWELELVAEREQFLLASSPERGPVVLDGRLAADRAFGRSAARFWGAWLQVEPLGPDGECPSLRRSEELPYLLGLVSGALAVLYDRKAGSPGGFPVDTLLEVARRTECLDSEGWWHAPAALQAAAWASVPGSAPEGVDPWSQLEQTATAGEDSGVRLARALQVAISANAGRSDEVGAGIQALARALESAEPHPDYALLDSYAVAVALYESDLLWIRQTGHRTERLGRLPSEARDARPLAEDPFAEDPFAEPTSPGDADVQED